MRRFAFILIALVGAGLIGFAGFSVAARNPDGLPLRALGQAAGETYVFGYPLVLMDETRRTVIAAPDSGVQINTLYRPRALPGFGDEAVVRPNRDTLYLLAFLDLSQGPAILRYPETRGRYWMVQVMDAWTDVAGVAGSRTTGSEPGAVMIAGPGWDGPALPGMARIAVSTDMAWVIGRIAVAPTQADMAAGHALQDQFSMTAPSVSDPDYQPRATRPPDAVAGLAAETFFQRLAALMQDNPARPADAPMLAKLSSIGVQPGVHDLTGYGVLARSAIRRGVEAARDRLDQAGRVGAYGPTNWRTALDLGDYGTRYDLRAGVALLGLGANLPEDAIYPRTDIDARGRALSGDHVYQIRFAPGETPPAGAFWSVTSYDAQGFLLDTPRHVIGDRDALVRDGDGGLTLTISAVRPEDGAPSNWLPVTAGAPFTLTARLYDPEPAALSGDWRMPAVRRVDPD